MSWGTSACFAEMVSEDTVRAVVGDELYDRFVAAREAFDETDNCHPEGSLLTADTAEFDDADDPDVQGLLDVTQAIETRFAADTGIRVQLCWHGSEDCGSRYDDVDGWYWDADTHDLYVPSPALKALRKRHGSDAVARQFFTVSG